MKKLHHIGNLLSNVFVPTQHLWLKTRTSIMSGLFTLSLGGLIFWLSYFLFTKDLMSLEPRLEEYSIVQTWALQGIYYCLIAATLTYWLSRRRAWVSPSLPQKIGKRPQFLKNWSFRAVVQRSADRIVFLYMVLVVLSLNFLGHLPKISAFMLSHDLVG